MTYLIIMAYHIIRIARTPLPILFPYTTLFRSVVGAGGLGSPIIQYLAAAGVGHLAVIYFDILEIHNLNRQVIHKERERSEEHTSELQSRLDIVCRLLLERKK